MSKGSVGFCIQIIGRVIMIWDEVFIKIRVSFDGLMIRKKVLSESIKHIETHLELVTEKLGHISVSTFRSILMRTS